MTTRYRFFPGLILFFSAAILTDVGYAQENLDPIIPIDFAKVAIHDSFWSPRLERIRTVTIPHCIQYAEFKTGHIKNFERAATHKKGKHEGNNAFDSDVYKIMEGMANSLKMHPDKVLEQKMDEWIDKIAAAQFSDGYIDTYITLQEGIENKWTQTDLQECYCAGHLIEAAVAYYKATGKRNFLDIAIRLANRHWLPGHEEIEIALVKLYRVTHNIKYLNLSEWFIEQRGHGYFYGKPYSTPDYYQSDVPVKDARKIVGHAVRAMYLYSAVTDLSIIKKKIPATCLHYLAGLFNSKK